MGVQTLSLTWKIHGDVIQTGEESERTRRKFLTRRVYRAHLQRDYYIRR